MKEQKQMQDQISRNLCEKFFHSSRPALNYPSLKDAVMNSSNFEKKYKLYPWFAYWLSQLSNKPLCNTVEAIEEIKQTCLLPGELDKQDFQQKLLTAWMQIKL